MAPTSGEVSATMWLKAVLAAVSVASGPLLGAPSWY